MIRTLSLRIALPVVFATAVLAGCASTPSNPSPARTSDGTLVGPNGMTLYTFDKDAPNGGRSVCNGQCAANWPPLMASGGASSGAWTVVTRDDGSKQWAYRGKPLYYWSKDQKPGDRTGEGVAGAWHVARP